MIIIIIIIIIINSNYLACRWIVQIITPRMNYFPWATPEANNSLRGMIIGNVVPHHILRVI